MGTPLFIMHVGSDKIFVLVYVDDILITGSSKDLINLIISKLGSEFLVKDMGSLHYFLRVEANKTHSGIHLYQH